jgi:hypothetical protein
MWWLQVGGWLLLVAWVGWLQVGGWFGGMAVDGGGCRWVGGCC